MYTTIYNYAHNFYFTGIQVLLFSNDHEPVHIHIAKGGAEAKYNLIPRIRLVKNLGFKKTELKLIEAMITKNKGIVITCWIDFFNNR